MKTINTLTAFALVLGLALLGVVEHVVHEVVQSLQVAFQNYFYFYP